MIKRVMQAGIAIQLQAFITRSVSEGCLGVGFTSQKASPLLTLRVEKELKRGNIKRR